MQSNNEKKCEACLEYQPRCKGNYCCGSGLCHFQEKDGLWCSVCQMFCTLPKERIPHSCQPQNEAKVIVRQDVMHDFQISIDEAKILFEAVLFRMKQSASSTATATLLRENDMQISLLARLEKILTPSHDNP